MRPMRSRTALQLKWKVQQSRRLSTGISRSRWPPHQDHDPGVDLEENVQLRFTRNAVVCSEVTLPFHHLGVARKCLERHRGG